MDVMEAIKQRHSYRAFTGEPVDRALIERVLDAARLAPSSQNSQPWRFDVAVGETRNRVDEIMGQTTVYLDEYLAVLGEEPRIIEAAQRFASNMGNAPVVIAVSVPRGADELQNINALLAVGCAIENLVLAATGLGLASCNVTFSYWVRDELAQLFGITPDHVIVTLIALGVPSEPPAAPEHKADVVHWHE
jgi:nitroreductase